MKGYQTTVSWFSTENSKQDAWKKELIENSQAHLKIQREYEKNIG